MGPCRISFFNQNLHVTLLCTCHLFTGREQMFGINTDLNPLCKFNLFFCGQKSGFTDSVEIDPDEILRPPA